MKTDLEIIANAFNDSGNFLHKEVETIKDAARKLQRNDRARFDSIAGLVKCMANMQIATGNSILEQHEARAEAESAAALMQPNR